MVARGSAGDGESPSVTHLPFTPTFCDRDSGWKRPSLCPVDVNSHMGVDMKTSCHYPAKGRDVQGALGAQPTGSSSLRLRRSRKAGRRPILSQASGARQDVPGRLTHPCRLCTLCISCPPPRPILGLPLASCLSHHGFSRSRSRRLHGRLSASGNVFKKTIPVYFLEIQEISITLRTGVGSTGGLCAQDMMSMSDWGSALGHWKVADRSTAWQSFFLF